MGRGSRDWVRDAGGWDGALPFLVALSPEVLQWAIPGRDLALLVSMLVVPMVAALVRAHSGERQIRRISPDRPAWVRQAVFGLAIALLMVFEGALAVLQFERVTSPLAWLAALGTYLVYLALVVAALRPPGPRWARAIRRDAL